MIYFIYSVLTGILTTFIGLSNGIDVYKQNVGCKWKVPQLQYKVNAVDRKQKELIYLKDTINMAWGSGQHGLSSGLFFGGGGSKSTPSSV